MTEKFLPYQFQNNNSNRFFLATFAPSPSPPQEAVPELAAFLRAGPPPFYVGFGSIVTSGRGAAQDPVPNRLPRKRRRIGRGLAPVLKAFTVICGVFMSFKTEGLPEGMVPWGK